MADEQAPMDYELIRWGAEIVDEADVLDELECSCYESAPCAACRLQTAVRGMAKVLVSRMQQVRAAIGKEAQGCVT